MTTQELVDYYVDLLIIQYRGKANAEGTIATTVTPILMPQSSIQVLTFSSEPDAGSFRLEYDEVLTSALAFNATASDIQTALRAIPGLEDVEVTGSFVDGFTVHFVGVLGVAYPLEVKQNTLTDDAAPVTVAVVETDEIIPLAVENGFNLSPIAGPVAIGAQLDVVGRYVGVTRTGTGFNGQIITLSDSDFASLIQIAIARNSLGSSLYDIQMFIKTWFEDKMLVFDYQNMTMSYLLSTQIGSIDLVQMVITQNLLPVPMAVGVGLIIYAPIITTFFGFRTYGVPAFNSSPFNTYDDYQTDWPWLSYANALST